MFGNESASVGRTVGVDPESHLVDGDVMMEPTDSYQVVGVVAAAVGSLSDVVGQCSLTSRVYESSCLVKEH